MLIYRQSTGEVVHDSQVIGIGKSGSGEYRNNSGFQHKLDGPIPRGRYSVDLKLRLLPNNRNEMFQRHGFAFVEDCGVYATNTIMVPPDLLSRIRAAVQEDSLLAVSA